MGGFVVRALAGSFRINAELRTRLMSGKSRFFKAAISRIWAFSSGKVAIFLSISFLSEVAISRVSEGRSTVRAHGKPDGLQAGEVLLTELPKIGIRLNGGDAD